MVDPPSHGPTSETFDFGGLCTTRLPSKNLDVSTRHILASMYVIVCHINMEQTVLWNEMFTTPHCASWCYSIWSKSEIKFLPTSSFPCHYTTGKDLRDTLSFGSPDSIPFAMKHYNQISSSPDTVPMEPPHIQSNISSVKRL